MLQVKDLNVSYGKIQALRKVSMYINEGETVTIIGANGAGKTTLLKTIMGFMKPNSGEISLFGNSIAGLPSWKIVEKQIALVPEGRHVFPEMTVLENLMMGAFLRKDQGEINKDIERTFEQFPKLASRRQQLAGTLSGGEQQMLAIGRALMSQPKLLLLDEPSMGLAPIIIEEIFKIIKQITKSGTTVLLVEQNALMALTVADRGYVLETGKIIMEDQAAVLLDNEEVKKAYLGI
jgi:branched-chain amino acid transport system ATP-binding protein